MIDLKPFNYNCQCDINRCHKMAKISLCDGLNICPDCLEEIVKQAKPEEPEENPFTDEGLEELEAMTFNELRSLAKGREVDGYGKMKKEELIKALL